MLFGGATFLSQCLKPFYKSKELVFTRALDVFFHFSYLVFFTLLWPPLKQLFKRLLSLKQLLERRLSIEQLLKRLLPLEQLLKRLLPLDQVFKRLLPLEQLFKRLLSCEAVLRRPGGCFVEGLSCGTFELWSLVVTMRGANVPSPSCFSGLQSLADAVNCARSPRCTRLRQIRMVEFSHGPRMLFFTRDSGHVEEWQLPHSLINNLHKYGSVKPEAYCAESL